MAQVKRIRRSISGILVLDKPRGMSSNQALQKVRWLLNAEKAGHTGSLDPLATGVLPLSSARRPVLPVFSMPTRVTRR